MSADWRTVRVFISSTFRDMHRERDHLVRVVFPELRERCRARHVHLVDVDLRWGVTEADAEHGKALDICLDEIDGCRPYFLGVLGHRFGYVPEGHRHSITAQEIYHGVLHGEIPTQVVDLRAILEGQLEGRTLSTEQKDCLVRCYAWDADRGKYLLRDDLPPTDAGIIRSVFERYSIYQKDRSFFFFRSEALTRQLAGTRTSDFFEQRSEDRDALASLKKEIADAGLPCFDYGDIEAFGRLVLDALWARIDAEPAEEVEDRRHWLDQEAELHHLFMADRTRRFVGRREVLGRLHRFCDDTPSLLVISGTPGCGKSALTARFTEEARHRHPDWLILAHFVGASSSSTSLRQMLRRLCTHLNRAAGAKEDAPQDIKELLQLFPVLLARVGEQRGLLIVIDAVNQLEQADHAHTMHWLPQVLPVNVRMVVSTLAGDAHDALRRRRAKPVEETVTGFTPPETRELVRTYLREIRHEFPNPAAEEDFYRTVEQGNPLHILVALEELRVFGRFEELGGRINSLPDNVPALFEQVLERVESDFTPALVGDCLSYIACGRHGMTAEELQSLLRGHASPLESDVEAPKLPDMSWTRLRRSLGSYLFERSGVIDFFHGQLEEAVAKRYLAERSRRVTAHRAIADYLQKRWSEPYARALDELPYQHTRAGDGQALAGILGDLQFLELKCQAGMTYDLAADYDSALSAEAVDVEPRRGLEEFARFVSAQSHLLARNAALTFQQAANEPDATAPARAARARLEAGLETRPWLEHVNKPQQRSACLMTLAGHNEGVTACAFSPDGHRIVSASGRPSRGDQVLKVWDARTGANLATLTGHTRYVKLGGFSPDGLRILSFSHDRTLRLWDSQTGDELATLTGHAGSVRAGGFSPDGHRIVSASQDSTLKLWDAQTGRELATLTGHTNEVMACDFSPDGRRIVSASDDATLRVWDVQTGASIVTLRGHTDWVRACAFSPDGARIVSASNDATLKLWDAETGVELITLAGHDHYLTHCALSPDGARIVSAAFDDNSPSLWDARTGVHVATLTAHTQGVTACAFSPDGRRVASTSWDGTLRTWDAETGAALATLACHGGPVNDCAFSPDGRWIVSASDDRTLKLWDAEAPTDMAPAAAHAGPALTCAFFPDGRRVAANSGHTFTVVDAQSGAELARLAGHAKEVNVCAVSPDGRRIVSAALHEENLKLWDAQTGVELATLAGHKNIVTACDFSPDGRRVVSASSDRTLKIWDAETGALTATLAGHEDGVNACAYSPDGSQIVSASSDYAPKLWDARTGAVRATLSCHTRGVNACAFSPDGRRVATASDDETLKLWDARTGAGLATLRGHGNDVYACTFSPDGTRIVSASKDDSLMLWNAQTGARLAALVGHASRVVACAFSPDGNRIVSVSWDNTLRLWDARSGAQARDYELQGFGRAAAWSPSGCELAAGGGRLFILRLRNFSLGPVIVTPWWRKNPRGWVPWRNQVKSVGIGCPLCRAWSDVAASARGNVIPCPHCGQRLQLNPFTIDADWRPVAAAWGAMAREE